MDREFLKFICKEKKVELIISKKLITKLQELGNEHFPNEYGGFLIGKYSKNLKQLIICDTVLPVKYKSFPLLFERSTENLKEKFDKIFINKKQYYIGEWHTHPNGSSMFSKTDLEAMTEIANCETVIIKNPILLILSVDKCNLLDFSFYFYDKRRLFKYEQD